jgi:hypothetical protein
MWKKKGRYGWHKRFERFSCCSKFIFASIHLNKVLFNSFRALSRAKMPHLLLQQQIKRGQITFRNIIYDTKRNFSIKNKFMRYHIGSIKSTQNLIVERILFPEDMMPIYSGVVTHPPQRFVEYILPGDTNLAKKK